MARDDLSVKLRWHHMQHSLAKAPKLSVPLRSLHPNGPVLPPMRGGGPQAVVVTRITRGDTTGNHIQYLQHKKGIENTNAPIYGKASQDIKAFVARAQEDPRQFRITVSVPPHDRLDRTQCITLLMAQMERDLQRPLDWAAANHYDTGHPHTHITLRGKDLNGKVFYMANDYMTYGIRARMAELLNAMLGRDQAQSLAQQQARMLTQADGIARATHDPDAGNRAVTGMSATDRTTIATIRRIPDGIARGADDPDTAQRRPQRTLLQDITSLAQRFIPERTQDTTSHRTDTQASLLQRLAAMQQTSQEQQRRQQRGNERGY